MKKPFSNSRRDFLKTGVSGLGYGLAMYLMPFPVGLFSSTAKAATKGKRQHLINIVDIGGWDTFWYYHFFDPALNSKNRLAPPTGWSDIGAKLRYGTNDGRLFPGSTQKIAPGMKFFTDTDLSRLSIWKGASFLAGHGQNNFIFGGGTSPYNASYSSLISAYQADTRGQSTLHYVKLSGSSQDFWVLPGMLTGVAVPTCIPDQLTWGKLTSAASNPSMLMADSVNSAVSALGGLAKSHVTRPASQGVVQGFASGYVSANFLSTSNYASSDAFQQLWLRYFKAMKQEAVDQIASGYGVIGDFKTEIKNALTPLSNFTVSTTADLTTATSDFYILSARNTAWLYAMSAFLVINDLSAVVDLHPSGGDNHTGISSDYLARMFGFVGFRELTRHLSTVSNPDGGTMLDATLLTYTSEFDRTSIFIAETNGGWGTGHGTNFSAIIAGHKTNTGKIVGGVRMGDSTSIPVELRGIDGAVGTDPNTGAVTGGDPLNPKSLLPTVLQMFGVPVPAQQITECTAIPALIKS